MDLSHSEYQAGGGDESMIGDPHTPTPAPRPRRSVSFNLDEQEDINYEKYASPTGPRYVKTKVDPYSRTRTDPYPLDHEEDTSIMAELNRSKPIATCHGPGCSRSKRGPWPLRRRSSVEGVDTAQEAQGRQAGEAPDS